MNDCIDPQTGLFTAWDGGRDNELLFTATYVALTKDRSFKDKVHEFVLQTSHPQYQGLFCRYPGNETMTSHDNMIGLLYLESEYNSFMRFPRYSTYCILDRGWKYKWCFNYEIPDKFNWRGFFGRFTGFPAYVEQCIMPNWGAPVWWQLGFIVACLLSPFDHVTWIKEKLGIVPHGTEINDVGNRILQWVQNQRMADNYPRSVNLWNKRMLKRYCGGIHELCWIYHTEDHPITKAAERWKGKF